MRRWGLIVGCGFVLLAFAGCATVRSRDDRDASSAAQSALVQQLSQTAQAAIDRRDYGQARADLERLVVESPRSAEAYHRLGRVLHLQGQFDEAKRSYRKALEIDPEYVGALIGLGEIEDRLGQAEPALQTARRRPSKSTRRRPRPTSPAVGSSRRPAGSDEALAAYFRTLELEPELGSRHPPDRHPPTRSPRAGPGPDAARPGARADPRRSRGPLPARPGAPRPEPPDAGGRRLANRLSEPSQSPRRLLQPRPGPAAPTTRRPTPSTRPSTP